jgi:glycosyltransferase involved in cell wall biosynthesis
MGQIINESGAGYLVPYGNVAALKQTLQYVFSHPQEAHQKVIAGQRFIRNRLDWQMLATELESIYKPLALCGPRKMFVRRGGRPCPRTGGTSAPADDQESR